MVDIYTDRQMAESSAAHPCFSAHPYIFPVNVSCLLRANSYFLVFQYQKKAKKCKNVKSSGVASGSNAVSYMSFVGAVITLVLNINNNINGVSLSLKKLAAYFWVPNYFVTKNLFKYICLHLK